MQRIEQYSGWIIDKVFEYFGDKALPYKSVSAHRQTAGLGESSLDAETERYTYLLKYFKDDALTAVLHLAVAQYLYPEFYHMLKKLTGQAVTMHFALQLTGEEGDWSLQQLKGGYEILRRYLFLEKKAENFLYSELYADERLVLYLAGSDEIAEPLREIAELSFGEELGEEVFALEQWESVMEKNFRISRQSENSSLFQLCAERGWGRKTLLRRIAQKDERGWVFVNFPELKGRGENEFARYLWLIRREAFFYGFGICYHDFVWEKETELERYLQAFLEKTKRLFYPVCICTEEKADMIAQTALPVIKLDFPQAGRQERIALWKGYAESRKIPLDYEKYGVTYRMTPGAIKKVFDGMEFFCTPDMTAEEQEKLTASLCIKAHGSPKRGSLCLPDGIYVMEDLKLEQKQKEMLENICAYIRYSHKVYDIWNMESRFAYGKGVTALFCGPPGTGKTMAAHVLAEELQLPLYRIDLSQVVDKYIGETEKKLEEIFTYAQKSNVILFFDEADSIFGKRTEVRESKDKYANTEVSYILQRIEQYDGVVILATNLRNNIDEAFMRRMKYVVEFKMPDSATRKKIWQGGFSKEIPMENIDFDYLAEKVELSGGYIKNIILNAVFLGAKEGSQVTMKHILMSTCNEYLKLGKVMVPQDFEKYAYYFYQ